MLTTKKDMDRHGFGLLNMRKVAEKYYGDLEFSFENGEFKQTAQGNGIDGI